MIESTLEFVGTMIAGGALAKVVDAIISYRRSTHDHRLAAATAEAAEDANERKRITFAMKLLEERIEALTKEVHEAQERARALELQLRVVTSLLERHTDLQPEEIARERERLISLFGGVS